MILGSQVSFHFAKVAPVRLLTSAVCAALPESIGNLQNLTVLRVQRNALQGKCRVVPSRTSVTSGLSPVSVFVFADAEKQRVRAALPDCGDFYL